MKGTKKWKTVSKWRRLCHQEGQLILYTLKPCEVNVSNITQKMNCNSRDNWTPEHLQVILHYPDQGDGEYTTDPTYGKSMSYGLLIYVSERRNFYQILLQDSEQI